MAQMDQALAAIKQMDPLAMAWFCMIAMAQMEPKLRLDLLECKGVNGNKALACFCWIAKMQMDQALALFCVNAIKKMDPKLWLDLAWFQWRKWTLSFDLSYLDATEQIDPKL